MNNLFEHLSWWEMDSISDATHTIVGAGIVGVNAAISIKEQNPTAKVLILDKMTTPLGASMKNAGFACFGSISEILDDYSHLGESKCRDLIKMRWDGLAMLRKRVGDDKMDYRPLPGAEIFDNENTFEKYRDQLSFANSLVADIVESDHCYTVRNGRYGDEIVNRYEGCLNPEKMMFKLRLKAQEHGVRIISGIEIKQIDKLNKKLITNLGGLSYHQLIVCTNGFTSTFYPHADVVPARNQVLITTPIKGFTLDACYHYNKGYVYFREIGGRLLLGGGRDLDLSRETTTDLGQNEKILDFLKDLLATKLLKNKDFEIEKIWSGILGVGKSKEPIIEKVDDSIILAVRMGGMGVAIGSVIGDLAAELS